MLKNISGPQIMRFRLEKHLTRIQLALLMQELGRWTNLRRIKGMEQQTCKVYDRDLTALSLILERPVGDFLGDPKDFLVFCRQQKLDIAISGWQVQPATTSADGT